MTYLVNTNKPVPYVLQLQRDNEKYAELARARYRLPAVWFMFFNESDLIDINCEYNLGNGETTYTKTSMPCTTKEQALDNIQSSFDYFKSVFNDVEIAESYLQKTIEVFVELDFDYLVFDATEFLLMNMEEDEWFKFQSCFKRDNDAAKYIRELSGFTDGVAPYSVEELYKNPYLEENERLNNSNALDPNFETPGHRLTYPFKIKEVKKRNKPKPSPSQNNIQVKPKIKWWQFWKL